MRRSNRPIRWFQNISHETIQSSCETVWDSNIPQMYQKPATAVSREQKGFKYNFSGVGIYYRVTQVRRFIISWDGKYLLPHHSHSQVQRFVCHQSDIVCHCLISRLRYRTMRRFIIVLLIDLKSSHQSIMLSCNETIYNRFLIDMKSSHKSIALSYDETI